MQTSSTTAAESSTGALKLTVRTPDGELWYGACAVFAEPIATDAAIATGAPHEARSLGAEVEVSQALQRGPEVVVALTPGRWRVRVDPEEPLLACSAGSAPAFALHGAARTELEIRAHEITALELRLLAGGRLNLMLVPPASFKDARIEKLLTSPSDELCQHALELCAAKSDNPCAIVTIVNDPTPQSRRMSFLAPGCTRLAADRAIPGIACTSENFLEAGPITLGIETPGFEPLKTTVTIESGRDTFLRLELKSLPAGK